MSEKEEILECINDLKKSIKEVTVDRDLARDEFWKMRTEELQCVIDRVEIVAKDIHTIKSNQIEFSRSISVIDEIKTALSDHAINIKKFNEILIGAKSIMWVGKIIIGFGTVIGGVWAFFFRHNP